MRSTSAPRLASSIAACGPGPMPANSITRSPDNGPCRAAPGSSAIATSSPSSIRAAQEGARHDLEHDFVRAAVDALHPRVGPGARDRIFGHVAVAAVELDAQVAGAALQLRQPELRLGGMRSVEPAPGELAHAVI